MAIGKSCKLPKQGPNSARCPRIAPPGPDPAWNGPYFIEFTYHYQIFSALLWIPQKLLLPQLQCF
jgi:hypothetical protein